GMSPRSLARPLRDGSTAAPGPEGDPDSDPDGDPDGPPTGRALARWARMCRVLRGMGEDPLALPEPYVPADKKLPELRPVPLLVGVLLGIVFGASSLYLALKVGMTVSASIPIAVLSVIVSRALSYLFRVRRTTILENNIVQTTGSAGESIAFG